MWPGAMYHDDGNEHLSEILVPIYDKTLSAFSLPSLSAFSFLPRALQHPSFDEDKIIGRTIIEVSLWFSKLP